MGRVPPNIFNVQEPETPIEYSSIIFNQNLNSPKCFSPSHPYQLSEPKLSVKIQEVPPNLLDIQPHLYQVWNCGNLGIDPNVNCNNMVCTYKFFLGDRVLRTQIDEIAPFWCTALIFNRVYVKFIFPYVVVH